MKNYHLKTDCVNFVIPNEIEDEKHFVFKCKYNEQLRTRILNNLKIDSNPVHNDDADFPTLWNTLFVRYPRQLSKFIISGFENRRNKLYVNN